VVADAWALRSIESTHVALGGGVIPRECFTTYLQLG
jgi:hypothetical protein